MYRDSIFKTSKYSNKLLSIAIVLLPILNSSFIGDTTFGFGDLFLLIVFLITVFPRQITGKVQITEKLFWVFLAYFVGISFASCLFIQGYSIFYTFNTCIKYVFYTYLIYACREYIDWKYAVNSYLFVCSFESVYLIIQLLLTISTGHAILPYVFPYANMEYQIWGSDYNSQLVQNMRMYDGVIRGVGFFPEPSHFAEYCIFSIVFLLQKKRRNKKDVFRLIIISLSIFLTMSALGIFSYIIVFLWFYFTKLFKGTKKQFFSVFVIGIILIFLFIICGRKFGLFDFINTRVNGITNKRWGTSGNLRIVRGFAIFDVLPNRFKVFGIGAGNFETFVSSFGIHTFLDATYKQTSTFMNGFSSIMVYSGLIGTLLYCLFFVKKNILSQGFVRTISLIMLMFMFTEYFLFTSIFFLGSCFMNLEYIEE